MKSNEHQKSVNQELDKDCLAQFGIAILDLLSQRGWNTIPRREMTLHLLHFAEQARLLDLTAPRMRLAAMLKVSPATLDGLIRDKALVCGNVSSMGFEEFVDWAKNNNQTGYDDAQKGILTFSLQSLEQGMQVEGFLDFIGLVPDYRNNRRLLVIDLSRLVAALAQKNQQTASELLLQLEEDEQRREELSAQTKGSEKKLLQQFLKAIHEQGNKHIGEETVGFMISLFKKGKGWIGKKG
jgi:hypothetical protein